MDSHLNIMKALAGKNQGLKGGDLRSLYKSYVRPGGTCAMKVWGPFTSDAKFKSVEAANNTAGRIITGLPRGSPIPPLLVEAQLTTLPPLASTGL